MKYLKFFYVVNFMRNLIPVFPVYVLLFQSRGLSLGQISFLLAIWSVPVVLLELPSGLLADNWSRKHMLSLGFLLNAACFVLWYFSQGFGLYALGFILWGISEAFCSGSFEGLLFDTLKRDGRENEFDRIYGKANFYAGISLAVSMFTGGFLSTMLGMGNVLLISVLTLMITFFLSLRLKEVNYYKNNTGGKADLKQGLNTLKDAARFLTGHGKILFIALTGILVVGISGIIDEYDPLIADSFHLNLTWIGIWGGSRFLLEALGSQMAWRLRGLLNRLHIRSPFSVVWVFSVISAACMGLFGLWGKWILLPLYGLFYMLLSSALVILEDWLQQRVEEQGRATVHSLLSLAYNAYGILFCSVFALVMPEFKTSHVLLGISAYMLLLSLVMGMIYRLKIRKAEQ